MENYDPLFQTGEAERRPTKQPGQLRGTREFVSQNSLLTDLFQNKQIQTLQNMVYVSTFLFVLQTMVLDYFETKNSFFGALPDGKLLRKAFTNYKLAIVAWLQLMAIVVGLYFLTAIWAKLRPSSPRHRHVNHLFDKFCLVIYVICQFVFFGVTFRLLFVEKSLGIGAAIAVSLEQIRLMMKSHSFVREVTKRYYYADNEKKQECCKFPTFGRFVYFLFAPTLLYRDAYPRNEATNWRAFFGHVTEFVIIVALIYYFYTRFILPEFDRRFTAPQSVTFGNYLTVFLRLILIAPACYILEFYGFFHSWLNAWAELLRFGDRNFYSDWWTTPNYQEYYRRWNIVVHEWLYEYIYRESYHRFTTSKRFSTWLVFAISALWHEYVILAMLGFMCPVMFIQFGVFGYLMTLIKGQGRASNAGVLSSVFIGNAMLISMYLFESYVRPLCPPAYRDNSLLDLITPRLISCMKMQI